MVKRSWSDQNVKFYTYVNVLDEIKESQVFYYDDYEEEYESFDTENKYESYCYHLITEESDLNKNKSHSILEPMSENAKNVEKKEILVNSPNESKSKIQ